VIESHDLGEAGLKEIRLLLEWKLPLHLVYVVNERQDAAASRPSRRASRRSAPGSQRRH